MTDKEAGDNSGGIISGAVSPSDVSGTVEVIPVTSKLNNDPSISEKTSGSNQRQWWKKVKSYL